MSQLKLVEKQVNDFQEFLQSGQTYAAFQRLEAIHFRFKRAKKMDSAISLVSMCTEIVMAKFMQLYEQAKPHILLDENENSKSDPRLQVKGNQNLNKNQNQSQMIHDLATLCFQIQDLLYEDLITMPDQNPDNWIAYISHIVEIFSLINTQKHLIDMVKKFISWSVSVAAHPEFELGHPQLHLILARLYCTQGDYPSANAQYIKSGKPLEHAQFLWFWCRPPHVNFENVGEFDFSAHPPTHFGFFQEFDLFATSVCCDYLLFKNLQSARIFIDACLKWFRLGISVNIKDSQDCFPVQNPLALEEKVSWDDTKSGFPVSPILLPFCNLMIQCVQRHTAWPLFKFLVNNFQSRLSTHQLVSQKVLKVANLWFPDSQGASTSSNQPTASNLHASRSLPNIISSNLNGNESDTDEDVQIPETADNVSPFQPSQQTTGNSVQSSSQSSSVSNPTPPQNVPPNNFQFLNGLTGTLFGNNPEILQMVQQFTGNPQLMQQILENATQASVTTMGPQIAGILQQFQTQFPVNPQTQPVNPPNPANSTNSTNSENSTTPP